MTRAERAAAMHADLTRAVAENAAAVPCLGRTEWISDDVVVRLQAAAECDACPVRALCGAYAAAAGEKSGVWGGKDRQGTGPSVDELERRIIARRAADAGRQ